MDFTWYDAGLLGLFACTVAIGSHGIASTQKGECDDYSTWRAWTRVLELNLPQSRRFVLALVAAILESVCSTLQPVCMGAVIDMITAIVSKGDKDVKVIFDEMTYTCVTIMCLDAIKCVAIHGRERFSNSVGDFARQKAQVNLVVCLNAMQELHRFFRVGLPQSWLTLPNL
jgi:hypothetical protein